MNRFSNLKIASFFFSCSLLITSICRAQPSLTITSPTTGTVLAPGSSVQITVDTGKNVFTSVGIGISDSGLGPFKILTSPPYQFKVALPKDPLGPRQITAFAVDQQGNGFFSDPVTVDIEPATTVTSIGVTPNIINFSTVGEQIPLNISGKFSNGTIADITNSSRITYSVANTNVATVAQNGIITAAGAGGTTATVSCAGLSSSVPILVPLGESKPVYKIQAIQQGTVTKDQFGNYIVKIKITNNSNTRLWDISVTNATLNNTAAALIIPTTFTNTDPNISEDLSLTFSPSSGASKTTALLQIKGTYIGSLSNGQLGQPGALSFSFRIQLP